MLLSVIYVSATNALVVYKMASKITGNGIVGVTNALIMLCVFYYTLQVGLKLYKAVDKVIQILFLFYK